MSKQFVKSLVSKVCFLKRKLELSEPWFLIKAESTAHNLLQIFISHGCVRRWMGKLSLNPCFHLKVHQLPKVSGGYSESDSRLCPRTQRARINSIKHLVCLPYCCTNLRTSASGSWKQSWLKYLSEDRVTRHNRLDTASIETFMLFFTQRMFRS